MYNVRYVGPRNQLRGETGVVRFKAIHKGGSYAVQFDRLDLVVNGEALAYTWIWIKDDYLRFYDAEAVVMTISKKKSKAIARRTRNAIVTFDMDRMKRALAGPFHMLPSDLPDEEIRDWLLSHATKAEASRDPRWPTGAPNAYTFP